MMSNCVNDVEAAAKSDMIRTKAFLAAKFDRAFPVGLLLAVLSAHRGLWLVVLAPTALVLAITLAR